MKRGGGLHPARPDWWPPTKRPRAAPGGLITAGVSYLSRRAGVPPCLRTSPTLDRTLGIHQISWRIPFPRHASGVSLVLWFRGAWVSHAPLRVPIQRRPWDAASPPVSRSRLARSPAWHGLPQCLGYGHCVSYCCVALVFASGLSSNPANPRWGLGCVCLDTGFGFASPFLAGVYGTWVWALVLPAPRQSWLGCWGVCVCARALSIPSHS